MQSKAEKRKQARILAEIEMLRAKYGPKRHRKSPVAMPDLSCPSKAAPLSNRFAPTMGKKELPADAAKFPVGNSHKQGLELITPGMVKGGDLKYMGGKKF